MGPEWKERSSLQKGKLTQPNAGWWEGGC